MADLPPSAAEEPLPTPKATEAQPLSAISTVSSLSQDSPASLSLGIPLVSSNSFFSMPIVSLSYASSSSHSNAGSILCQPTIYTSAPSTASVNMSLESLQTNNVLSTKTSDISLPVVAVLPPVSDQRMSLNNDFFDLTEMLSGDLSAMEWSSDPGFVDLDLTEASMHLGSSALTSMTNSIIGGTIDSPSSSAEQMLAVPASIQGKGSGNCSEPDLASLGLHDGDADREGTGMQIDVSDWLDVIMPSTGLTPLSTNAPVSFSSDPILTPRTQQEVLDLFNFDETDFTTPSNPSSSFAWDRLTEPSTSSS